MNEEIRWEIASFEELSSLTLYQILRLRSQVFVVEQNDIYLDTDDFDQEAFHVIGYLNDRIIAYCRIFRSDSKHQASIGRVLVVKEFRGHGYGRELIDIALNVLSDRFNEKKITISAQLYLQKFYGSFGFKPVSEVYLDGSIEHIRMQLIR